MLQAGLLGLPGGGLRRGLQREYLARLSSLALGNSGRTDAQVIAAAQLRALEGRVGALLVKNDVKLDDYSRAHLVDMQARIRKVLDASIQLPGP